MTRDDRVVASFVATAMVFFGVSVILRQLLGLHWVKAHRGFSAGLALVLLGVWLFVVVLVEGRRS